MRRKKRIILTLASCMCTLALLTGCNQSETKTKTGETSTAETEKETILMAVGEENISVEEAKVYAYFLKHQYEGSIGRIIWDYQMEDGSLADYAKEQIQTLLSQVKILKQVAAKQEIQLSEDELEEARTSAIDFLRDISEDDKKENSLDEDLLTNIYAENILANKVFEISTNDVDTNIPDDEVKQITIQYLSVMTKGTDKNGNDVDMTDEEKKQAKKKAKQLLKNAKESTNFMAFAESNTDADEVELTFSKADAPEELADAAFGLSSGKMSGIVEGENGYYIIYCVNDDDEDATAKRKEELILERQKASFEKKFTEWSAEYPIIISTTLWDDITL